MEVSEPPDPRRDQLPQSSSTVPSGGSSRASLTTGTTPLCLKPPFSTVTRMPPELPYSGPSLWCESRGSQARRSTTYASFSKLGGAAAKPRTGTRRWRERSQRLQGSSSQGGSAGCAEYRMTRLAQTVQLPGLRRAGCRHTDCKHMLLGLAQRVKRLSHGRTTEPHDEATSPL